MIKRSKSDIAAIGLRIKEPLRAKIEKASKTNGRSMNMEMGARLERSFTRDDGLGGPRVAAMVETIGAAMKTAGEFAGFAAKVKPFKDGSWVENPYAFDQAVKAANAILESLRPPGEIVVPEPNVTEVVGGNMTLAEANEFQREFNKHLGEHFAGYVRKQKEEEQ